MVTEIVSSTNEQWLTQKHPDYERVDKTARMCYDFYLGGDDVLENKEYLQQHISESNLAYADRLKRKYYHNVIAGPVRTLANFIFMSPNILRSDGVISGYDISKPFLEDVDGQGSHINVFMKNRAIKTIVSGLDFIYVEPPYIQKENVEYLNLNISEIIKYDLLPRYYYINRENVTNWYDQDGELVAVIIQLQVNAKTGIRDVKNEFYKNNYLVWEKIDEQACQWAIYDDKFNIMGESKEPTIVTIPSIPLVPIYAIEKSFMLGKSLIEDSTHMAKAKYDLNNRIYDFLHYSATNLRFVPVMNDGEAQAIKEIKRGEQYFHSYSSQAGQPFILTPSQEPYRSMLQEDDRLTKAIYLTLKQRLQELADSSGAVSGESKKEDFKVTQGEIVTLAKQFQDAENMAHYFSMLWLTGDKQIAEELRIKASYPDNYDIDTLNDKLNEVMNLEQNRFPDEWIWKKKEAIMKNDPLWKSLTEEEQNIILAYGEQINLTPETAIGAIEKIKKEEGGGEETALTETENLKPIEET